MQGCIMGDIDHCSQLCFRSDTLELNIPICQCTLGFTLEESNTFPIQLSPSIENFVRENQTTAQLYHSEPYMLGLHLTKASFSNQLTHIFIILGSAVQLWIIWAQGMHILLLKAIGPLEMAWYTRWCRWKMLPIGFLSDLFHLYLQVTRFWSNCPLLS